MFRLIRNVITVLVFAGTVAIALATSIEVYRKPLPATIPTDPADLAALLSKPQFVDEPLEQKVRLIHRLELDFTGPFDWRDNLARLDDRQWIQFTRSFDDLTQIWFREKVRGYFARSEKRRNRYLERQIGKLKSWPVFSADATREDRGVALQPGIERLGRLSQLLERQYRQAPPEERQQMEAFLTSVVNHVMQRMAVGPGK